MPFPDDSLLPLKQWFASTWVSFIGMCLLSFTCTAPESHQYIFTRNGPSSVDHKIAELTADVCWVFHIFTKKTCLQVDRSIMLDPPNSNRKMQQYWNYWENTINDDHWLVVWNIFNFPYIGNNHPNQFRGLKPPTSSLKRHFGVETLKGWNL